MAAVEPAPVLLPAAPLPPAAPPAPPPKRFTPEQVKALERAFAVCAAPSAFEIDRIAGAPAAGNACSTCACRARIFCGSRDANWKLTEQPRLRRAAPRRAAPRPRRSCHQGRVAARESLVRAQARQRKGACAADTHGWWLCAPTSLGFFAGAGRPDA
jgi:hypothetical protein